MPSEGGGVGSIPTRASIWKIKFINLVKSSLNISEVLFKLGYTTKGNSWGYSQVKQRMKDLNLSGKDFRGKSAMITFNEQNKINLDELFCENSKHPRNILRKYILQNRILPYKCEICGISEWQNKKLSLELDHINGINNDNKIENLRFLCPNCHSQTITYGSKNKRTTLTNYDISDELKNLVIDSYIEIKNQKKICDKYNLKRAVVKQILLEANLLKQHQKYVIQYNSKHEEFKGFGSIAECCQWLMDNNLVRTKSMKTCKTTFNKNAGTLWKNYYFEILE